MTDYDGDSQVLSVAHSCRNYRPGNTTNRMSAAKEGISCGSCINWGGKGCLKDAFDSLSSDLDYNPSVQNEIYRM